MKTLLIAAVAVAVSGAAFAKDVKGTVMNDEEMDKVTAGGNPGYGPTGSTVIDGRNTQVWIYSHQGTNCHGPGCP
jgi:hypothetical protein